MSLTTAINGKEGDDGKALLVPVPEWVRSRYHPVIQKMTPDSRVSLEPEFWSTDFKNIALFRDRKVRVLTKS